MTEPRCPECGSWGVECANPAPVAQCGCARCAGAALAEARREVARLQRAEATFHEEYRQRCDAETKALHIEVERLRDRVFAVAGERDEARADAAQLRKFLADHPFPMKVDDALKRAEQAERERDEALTTAEARQQALIAAQIRHGHAYVAACRERDDARILLEEVLARWGEHDHRAASLLGRIRTFLGGHDE